jgi:hypothetical protein
VVWLVRNERPEPLRIEDAWVPHGRFRGDGHVALGRVVEAGGVQRLELEVAAVEAPGTVVANAFLIVRVRGDGEGWRVFARMQITFDADGAPVPVVENVTAQSLE